MGSEPEHEIFSKKMELELDSTYSSAAGTIATKMEENYSNIMKEYPTVL